ncbi:MAG TPA: hypothetical protein VGP72_01840 [Planctomycetota bacterium]|jgi:hypothetical protein
MESSAVVTKGATEEYAQWPFDARIDSWAEGTLMSIDADGAKLSIRGAKRPYASEYAKMLQSIQEKTAKLTQAERKIKASEIRQSWTQALETAHALGVEADSDLTFHLPSKNHSLVIVDETALYDHVTVSTGSTDSLTDAECAAVHAMKDLKVGECVVVGYERGILRNTAYVVIKANKCVAK